MDVMERIARMAKSDGRRMSKSQRLIAQYISEHCEKAAFMTASRLGEQVGVSESTVVRFAVALGFAGYPELQAVLSEVIRARLTSVQRVEMTHELSGRDVLASVLKADMQNIRRTIEMTQDDVFQDIIESLLSARNVYVAGSRSSSFLARFLAYYLNFALPSVILVAPGMSDILEQVVHIQPEDVLVAISFPRYSRSTVRATQYAAERGAKTVAITDAASSPLAEVATHSLTARSDMASFADSLVAPLSVINAIVVAIGMRRSKQLSETLGRMEHLWDGDRVYTTDNKP